MSKNTQDHVIEQDSRYAYCVAPLPGRVSLWEAYTQSRRSAHIERIGVYRHRRSAVRAALRAHRKEASHD